MFVFRALLLALVVMFVCLFESSFTYAGDPEGLTGPTEQTILSELLDNVPPELWYRFLPTKPPPFPIEKKPGHYTTEDWAAAIDSIWGPGLPVDEKLVIFNTFWNTIDLNFACFQGLSVDWDSVATVCRTEILDTVSRGRFCAMMQHATMSLMESHTALFDLDVARTKIEPGNPTLIGAQRHGNKLGAGLTPQPDSTVFVYRALPSQPFGLEVGDVVLGYDGIPWTQLLGQLWEAQLPLNGTWGSSETSFTHDWLQAVGVNWHLFDTIDIVKYQTGDTLHLPTNLMDGYEEYLNAYEHLPIPGVPEPDWDTDDVVTWGIIEGSNIGYIYTLAWIDDAEERFYNAIDSLMHVHETDGLIIDSRVNFGGNMWLAYRGFELLFNTNHPSVGFVTRSGPGHLDMIETQSPLDHLIYGDPATYYDKPIAVLTGPGALSSGDQVPLALTNHPMVRVFGKPTAAAYNSPTFVDIGQDVMFRYAMADAFLITDPGDYLTHDDLHVDEPVWLTPEMAVMGKDDVVEAAIAWILGPDADADGHDNIHDNCPYAANPDQTDVDGDMIGDSCDYCSDADGDGYGEPTFGASICADDNCPDIYNPNQEDTDNDLIGNPCDDCTDTDNDGFGNLGYPANTCELDNCPDVYNPDQTDQYGTGVGDICCCGFWTEGVSGNANCSEDGKFTLSDITVLIDHVYISEAPLCCESIGNTNGSTDGLTTLSDITRLIDAVYISKTNPAPCP